jgi:hypothetical protein
MVEAAGVGGVGIFMHIENAQLIENSKRTKITELGNCAQLERIWNTKFLGAP